jgi:hypothetical protein
MRSGISAHNFGNADAAISPEPEAKTTQVDVRVVSRRADRLVECDDKLRNSNDGNTTTSTQHNMTSSIYNVRPQLTDLCRALTDREE